jgi:hypothetical protein
LYNAAFVKTKALARTTKHDSLLPRVCRFRERLQLLRRPLPICAKKRVGPKASGCALAGFSICFVLVECRTQPGCLRVCVPRGEVK